MRKLLPLIILFFAACRCASSAPVSSSVIADARSRNVVVYGPESGSYCSGVALDAATVLTAGHCWAEKLIVNGQPAAVLKRSGEEPGTPDLMLLGVPTGERSALRIGDPKVAEYVISYATRLQTAGDAGLFNDGTVSYVGQSMLLRMTSLPGFSGAGIYGANGELLGIVRGIKTAKTDWAEIPAYCLAVPGAEIRKFLAK